MLPEFFFVWFWWNVALWVEVHRLAACVLVVSCGVSSLLARDVSAVDATSHVGRSGMGLQLGRAAVVVVVLCYDSLASLYRRGRRQESTAGELEEWTSSFTYALLEFLLLWLLFEYIAYLTGLNSNPFGSSDPWVAARPSGVPGGGPRGRVVTSKVDGRKPKDSDPSSLKAGAKRPSSRGQTTNQVASELGVVQVSHAFIPHFQHQCAVMAISDGQTQGGQSEGKQVKL
ncbi:hypothetical protein Taro_004854 [Colocasia esculenta]|uniref:Uncharacterized protein n=1 Tax=Colocasia esculenta TaxID=4460 RepID=A0A843TQR1_COLES|nr:hypothetical protein [Colocasia esculenta]